MTTHHSLYMPRLLLVILFALRSWISIALNHIWMIAFELEWAARSYTSIWPSIKAPQTWESSGGEKYNFLKIEDTNSKAVLTAQFFVYLRYFSPFLERDLCIFKDHMHHNTFTYIYTIQTTHTMTIDLTKSRYKIDDQDWEDFFHGIIML